MLCKKFLSYIMPISMLFLIVPRSEAISPIPGDTPSRTCAFSGFLTITGGTDAFNFPVVVPCPHGGGACSKWEYQLQWADGVPPALALFSVAADLGIRQVNHSCASSGAAVTVVAPGIGVPSFGVGRNDFGQRWLRFACGASSSTVTIITDLSEPVAGTAAGSSSKDVRFCQLQTPGKQLQGDGPNAAMTIQVIEQLDCGTVMRDLDPRGYTTTILPMEGSCTVENEILTNGQEQPTLYVDPSSRITFQGSRRYCWPNSFGSLTCVN